MYLSHYMILEKWFGWCKEQMYMSMTFLHTAYKHDQNNWIPWEVFQSEELNTKVHNCIIKYCIEISPKVKIRHNGSIPVVSFTILPLIVMEPDPLVYYSAGWYPSFQLLWPQTLLICKYLSSPSGTQSLVIMAPCSSMKSFNHLSDK